MKFYILDNTAKSVSQNEFLDYYGSKYFSDYPQNDIELEKYIECKLQAGDVDYKCIMWKMGTSAALICGFNSLIWCAFCVHWREVSDT